MFEGRNPFSPAVRLMLTELDEVVIGRGAPRSWTRSGRVLELRIGDFEISRQHELLRDHRGNVTAVGRSFGKAPIQIRRWCRRLGIEIGSFRG